MQTICIQPRFQFFRTVAFGDPARQGLAIGIGLREIQKNLQPALLALGKMQIGKRRELPPRDRHRIPAIAMNDVERGSEAGAILAARAFQYERAWCDVKGRDQLHQHLPGRQFARIQHGVEMGDAGAFGDGGFIFPPTEIVIAAAQVDDGADTAALQKRPEPACPGLHGARGFIWYHPVEVIEDISDCSGRGRSHRMPISIFGSLMRITKQVLSRRWAIFSLLAALVFAVLAWSDLRLKSLSGFGTADLQGFATADQYRQAFLVWPSRYAVRAGFIWGLDYLLMPLYAAAFFYSGILVREAFAPRPGRLRRILTLLAAVPIAGAFLDAAENALQLGMMLSGATDQMAGIALSVSNAKWVAIGVGVALWLGAVLARQQERLRRRLGQADGL
jgi:hypothetical protein